MPSGRSGLKPMDSATRSYMLGLESWESFYLGTFVSAATLSGYRC